RKIGLHAFFSSNHLVLLTFPFPSEPDKSLESFNAFSLCLCRSGPKVRPAIVEKAVKTPERPDGFELEVFAERQPAEDRSIPLFRDVYFHDSHDPPLPRNLVHTDKLESIFSDLSLFDFQIPNLFEL